MYCGCAARVTHHSVGVEVTSGATSRKRMSCNKRVTALVKNNPMRKNNINIHEWWLFNPIIM